MTSTPQPSVEHHFPSDVSIGCDSGSLPNSGVEGSNKRDWSTLETNLPREIKVFAGLDYKIVNRR